MPKLTVSREINIQDLLDILYSNDIHYWANNWGYINTKNLLYVIETEHHERDERNIKYEFTPQEMLDKLAAVAADTKHASYHAAVNVINDIFRENTDISTADILWQIAAFGELVYS